jgi:acetone carboxylase gamma subunit
MTDCPKEKFAFDTFAEADKARLAIARRAYKERMKLKYETGEKQKRVKVRVYICPECGKWHVGRGAKGKDAEWNKRKVFLRET